MNRYQPATFRASFAIAALALSALTMGMAVGMPASVCDYRMADVASAQQVTISPARVDVVATRVKLAAAASPHVD